MTESADPLKALSHHKVKVNTSSKRVKRIASITKPAPSRAVIVTRVRNRWIYLLPNYWWGTAYIVFAWNAESALCNKNEIRNYYSEQNSRPRKKRHAVLIANELFWRVFLRASRQFAGPALSKLRPFQNRTFCRSIAERTKPWRDGQFLKLARLWWFMI